MFHRIVDLDLDSCCASTIAEDVGIDPRFCLSDSTKYLSFPFFRKSFLYGRPQLRLLNLLLFSLKELSNRIHWCTILFQDKFELFLYLVPGAGNRLLLFTVLHV